MESLRRAFRGYDTVQVDTLLSSLNTQVEHLKREIEALRGQHEQLLDENRETKTRLDESAARDVAVQAALVSAHRQSEEILANARHEAEVLLQVARETGARLQDDLRGRIDDLNWQIERLSLQKQRFQDEFKTLLEGHLAQLIAPGRPSADRSPSGSESELAVERMSISAEPEEASS